MNRKRIGAWAACLAAVSLTTLAAPPQPQLHVAPNGTKQLRFNWQPVSGATSYELWFQSSAAAAETRFFQMPSSQTSVVNNVAVHLLDWSGDVYGRDLEVAFADWLRPERTFAGPEALIEAMHADVAESRVRLARSGPPED